jgi:acyl carrier protein
MLTENEIFDRIQHVVTETLNVPAAKVTRDAAFRADLGADSLDLVSMITELEDAFDHKLNDDDAMVLQTVGDAVKFIQETLSGPAN